MFKFVEQPENNEKLSDQKHKVKFKIMSLKVKEGVDWADCGGEEVGWDGCGEEGVA